MTKIKCNLVQTARGILFLSAFLAMFVPVMAYAQIVVKPVTGPAPALDEDGNVIVETPENAETVQPKSVNDYEEILSFPLTEEKMMAFAQSAHHIDQINRKWDFMISSAKTDSMAVEYNNYSVEEISSAMQNLENISVEEYNKMFSLTANDAGFRRLVTLYQESYEDELEQEMIEKIKAAEQADMDKRKFLASPENKPEKVDENSPFKEAATH